MSNEEFINLAGKVADGIATPGEVALYNAAYQTLQQDQQSWEEMDLDPLLLEKESLQRFWKEVIPTKRRIFKLWSRIVAAASIVLCFGLGLYLYNSNKNKIEKLAIERKIVPGSNKAYLTLANGKQIVLNDAANGKLATETGVEITKTANGQVIYNSIAPQGNNTDGSLPAADRTNAIETPRGGQYQVRLPDGTNVWLNAASKLTYPVSFLTKKERLVTLTGEAYFEVAKDKEHPFRVKSRGQEIEVLGTHFNINSYNDEPVVKTTLLEGSVKVSSQQGSGILKPGEQAVYSPGNRLSIVPADLESAIAWKKGDFSFHKENLRSVMQKISRWYDVEIEYQGNIPDYDFTGTISRFGKVNEVLNLLELTGMVHFKIEGRRIIVMP